MVTLRTLMTVVCLIILQEVNFAQGWYHRNPFPSPHLYKAVSFPVPDTGYISDGYELYRTNDAGASWNNIYVDYSFFIDDVKFLSVDTGFVRAENRIFRTTNGGQTWDSQILSVSNDNLYFRNSSVGYIYGAQDSWKTTDGGNTWAQVVDNLNAPISDMQFANDTLGYIITAGSLRKTTDGGLHWSVPLTGFSSVPICFSLVGTDTIFMSVRVSGYQPPIDIHIYRSTDGGSTWNAINMGTSLVNSFAAFDIHFFNSQEGCVAHFNQLYTTSDGGNTWLYHNMAAQFPGDCTITEMCWANPQNGYFAGEQGLLFKTADTGASYENLTDGYSTDFKAIYFSDTLRGLVAGVDYPEPLILRTEDAGVSWLPCSMDTASVVTNFCFNSELNGFAAAGRRLFTTSDGGSTWETLYSEPQTVMFNYLSFPDPGHLYTAGEHNVSVSHDGGVSWTDITPQGNFTGSFIDFTDSLTGFIVALDDGVFRTTNGGITWVEVYPLASYNRIYSMDFYSADHGVIADRDGGTRITHDGGVTWSETFPWYPFPIYVLMPDTNTILIVGEDGMTATSTNGGQYFNFDYYRTDFVRYFTMYFLDVDHGFAAGDNGMIKAYDACIPSVSRFELVTDDTPFFYPNPAIDYIQIKQEILKGQTNKIKLAIYSLDGRKIFSTTSVSQFIDITSLTSGTYLITLWNDNELRIQKLIIM